MKQSGFTKLCNAEDNRGRCVLEGYRTMSMLAFVDRKWNHLIFERCGKQWNPFLLLPKLNQRAKGI